jgi:tRNA dimethylallyltransferase
VQNFAPSSLQVGKFNYKSQITNHKSQIPIILGPTGVGKTAIGIPVAERLNGEIISADSRQIYRGMTIGTAKPSAEEQRRIPHQLVDILEPNEVFSAGEFVRRALLAIADIQARGKLPIIVGGAGLYIRALTKGIFTGESKDMAVRKELEFRYDSGEAEMMLEKLLALDPQYAMKVHLNDRKKIVRFFEIYRVSGMTISELAKFQSDGWIDPILIGLQFPREELYRRIDTRVDAMLEAGLIAEVEALKAKGFSRVLNALNSPGYEEVYDYLDGKIDFDTMKDLIKRHTRHYAKRQITWFKREEGVKWFEASTTPVKEICEYIELRMKN